MRNIEQFAAEQGHTHGPHLDLPQYAASYNSRQVSRLYLGERDMDIKHSSPVSNMIWILRMLGIPADPAPKP